MTDPLSTIRQNATWLVEANPEDLDGQLAKGILTACDDLEAERLTPEQARCCYRSVLHMGWDDEPRGLRAKLKRRAGD